MPDTAVKPVMNDVCRNQEENCLEQERKWKIVWVVFFLVIRHRVGVKEDKTAVIAKV